ncbi:UNVERIFIED_CONTAM: hypothetical protein NCL1_42626 [Trichonephila clavipes]
MELLQFLKVEIECRESAHLLSGQGERENLQTHNSKLIRTLYGGLPAIRKEKLSVYTFGNKTPLEKDYDVVKLTLENKDSQNLKIDIEALVIDQILAANIPPPQLDNIPQATHQIVKREPITILIGADYYYDIMYDCIKVSISTVAVRTENYGFFDSDGTN